MVLEVFNIRIMESRSWCQIYAVN